MTSARTWLCLIVAWMPGLALATGLGAALMGSPFVGFTDADRNLFAARAEEAANGPIGRALAWNNPDSGARGTLKATRAFDRSDTACRELRGRNTTAGRTETFRLTVCRAVDGAWALAPSEPSTPTT